MNVRHLFTTLLILFAGLDGFATSKTLVIAEVFYDTPLNENRKTDKTPVHMGEYVKIQNISDHTVCAGDWELILNNGVTKIPDICIDPGEFFIVAYRYDEENDFHSLFGPIPDDKIIPIYHQNTLYLANTKNTLSLISPSLQMEDYIIYATGSLIAQNGEGLSLDKCTSIHRRYVDFSDENFNQNEYFVDLVSPFVNENIKVYDPIDLDGESESPLATLTSKINATISYSDLLLSMTHNYVMSATYRQPIKAYHSLDRFEPIDPDPGLNDDIILLSDDMMDVSTKDPVISIDQGPVNITATPVNAQFNVSYYDGLGTADQEIQIGVPNVSSDIITAHQYDALRRKERDWCPAPSEGNRGAYVDLPTLEQCYSTVYVDNPDNCHSGYFYANDPTERIIETQKPGDSWKMSTGATSEYLTNEESGILSCYDLYYSQRDANYFDITGRHPSGTLSVVKITDEDEHETYLFKNHNDSIILERKIVDGEFLDTYRIYDALGNVRYILPPLASELLDNVTTPVICDTEELVAEYAYVYHYDSRNRLTSKKFPGIEPVYFVYDRLNNLVLSQDGNQRTVNQYTYNVYDNAGRMVIQGILTDNSSLSEIRDRWKNYAATTVYVGTSGTYYGYESLPLRQNESTDMITNVYYYDSYDFENMYDRDQHDRLPYYDRPGYDKEYSALAESISARDKLTGSQCRVLDDSNTMLYESLHYDSKGNLIQIRSENHLGGYDMRYYAYTFTGQPLLECHEQILGDSVTTDVYAYTYDAQERLIGTTFSRNGAEPITLSEMEYDELGRIRAKTLNGTAGSTKYSYNIHNDITCINNQYFKQYLYYDKMPDETPGYLNGNICSISYARTYYEDGHIFRNSFGYNFEYDEADRLYGANMTGDFKQDHSTYYNYDKNGNILNLTRYGVTDLIDDQYEYGIVDDITFVLDHNKLTSAEDYGNETYVSGATDFSDEEHGSVEYTYDANGNMTSDLNKGIVSIIYNHMNKPSEIVFKDGSWVGYLWDASGRKLAVEHVINLTTPRSPINKVDALWPYEPTLWDRIIRHDYCGDNIFVDKKMERTILPTGFLMNDTIYATFVDHQGNILALANTADNTWESTEYYPFGMPCVDQNGRDRYKFSGKEYDATCALNLYDFEARMYDPALTRFLSPDPLADRYPAVSPYAYCANNPIRNTDPSGEIIISRMMGREFILDHMKNGLYQFQDFGTRLLSNNGLTFIEYAINVIASTDIGQELIDRCINDPTIVEITHTNDGNAFWDKGSNGYIYDTIEWNPAKTEGGIHDDADGITRFRPPFIGLGHELAHFYDKINGTVDNTVWLRYEGKALYNDEKFACKIENQLRSAFNIPLRTHYLRLGNDNKAYRGYEPSRLINSVYTFNKLFPHAKDCYIINFNF